MKKDTFELVPPPEPSEADIQRVVLQYLKLDARVAWAHRFNVGAHVWEKIDRNGNFSKQFVRYAFPGCSDILGQMRDGRFLAVEVKTRKGRLSPDQKAFLDVVNNNGGIGLVARCVEDVKKNLC